jgi:hypothetical protein
VCFSLDVYIRTIAPYAIRREGIMMPKWLEWAHQLQAIFHISLTYATDPFDMERYRVHTTKSCGDRCQHCAYASQPHP